VESQVLYNTFQQEAFGIFIAIYFYLTGLSAGSFILSTLAYGFGMEKFKPIGRIGIILATVLLVIAPLFLLFHIGMPQNCLIYAYFMFTEKNKWTKIFAFTGLPLAILVHGYTGFILAFGKARALWNTALMPLLFLVSAIVSGIALMILVYSIKERFFSKSKSINRDLVFSMGKLLAWAIILDLFLVGCDLLVLSISHSDAQAVAHLILFGKFSFLFLFVENFLGKIVPLFLLLIPRFRTLTTVIIASILVIIGIFFMRYVVVLGGEFIPLI